MAEPDVQQQLFENWTQADLWLVARYVIMPDHIRLFAWATESSTEYENWVRCWKSQYSKKHRRQANQGWQTDHWDTRMRNEVCYDEKWQYVRQNPVSAGFVTHENDWPFQGEVFCLNWK